MTDTRRGAPRVPVRLLRALLAVALAASAAVVAPVILAGPAQAVGTTSQIQSDLAGLGYLPWSGIDGLYGPATTAAAKAFQANRCLNQDGQVGSVTWAQLTAVVKAVQTKAGTPADGLYGNATKSAVASWQSAHALAADGIAGPKTMAAMGITRVLACGCKTPVVSLKASGETDNYYTSISTSGVVTTSAHFTTRGPLNVGAPKLVFTLCYVSGFWRVGSVASEHNFADAKVYSWTDSHDVRHEEILGAGWGVWTSSIGASSVTLVARRCFVTPKTVTTMSVVRGVLALPWPVPIAVNVGQAALSALLPPAPPDTYYCGDLGAASMAYSVGADGALSYTSTPVRFFGNTATWQVPCSGYTYCSQTSRDIVTLSR